MTTKPPPSNSSRKVSRVWSTRWMIRKDLPAVMEIIERSMSTAVGDGIYVLADDCPTEDELLNHLRRRTTVPRVVEDPRSGQVVGVMVYSLFLKHYEIDLLAIAPGVRRTGAASCLLHSLISKLKLHRRRRIFTAVREDRVVLQQFLKYSGFRAVRVMGNEYIFQYQLLPNGERL